MPNASKYIIDVAKIRPGGNPIKGLYVGSSEKKYATLGNNVIYDKVLYELSVDNMSDVEPNAQTVTFNYTSKRTHGNGTEDTLYINPTTAQITANESTANTKTTNVTVNQALTANGTTTGTGVTVSIVQKKDYPTGISFSISPKSTIPASGGTVTSALTNYTYSVTANYKSGRNNVGITSDSNVSITASTTGVTASSKGTTTSEETNAGTIKFTASYTCNGVTKTYTVQVTIRQDANAIISYDNPTFTLSPGNTTLPASGGSVTGSVSAAKQVRHYSSKDSDTIDISSPSVDWTAQTISCQSRGTVTGGTLTLGTTTATVTANGKSTSKSYVVYQQENGYTDSWSNPVVTLSPTSLSFSSGASSQNITASAAQSGVTTYTSTASAYTSNSSFTWSWSANGTGFSVGNTGNVTSNTVSATANPSTSQRTGSVTANASGAGSKSGSKSATLTQAGEEESPTGPYYGRLNLDSVTLSCDDVPASGGTVYPSWAGTVYQYTYYLTPGGEETNTGWTNINSTVTVSWDPASKSGNNLGTTEKERTFLGNCVATFSGYTNQTAATQIDVYQQANAVTATTWNNPVVTITYGTFSAAGETKTPTCSVTQSGVDTYTSTSSAATSNSTFTWGNYSMTNGTGFTLQNATTGAVKADSRGTTAGAARSNNTIRRTATGAGSKQGTGSGTVTQEANAVTATTWSNPVVTVSPSSRSVGSADTSTSFTASATQSGVNTYTSTSSAATSNSTFTWAWSSNKTAFTANSTTTACTVSFTANPTSSGRSATITAKATGNSKEGIGTATVTQAGKQSLLTPSVELDSDYLYFQPSTITFTSAGTAQQIVIKCDSGKRWSITNSPSWVYLSSTAGTGDATITISASTNSSSSDRSDTMNVHYLDFSIMGYDAATINVEQEGEPSPSGYRFAIRLYNSTNHDIGIALSTTPDSSGVLVSGHTSPQSTSLIFDTYLSLTSNTQGIYMLVETLSSTGSFDMGFGTAPIVVQGRWLIGAGTQTVTTYSQRQYVVPGSVAPDPSGSYTWSNLSGEIAIYAMPIS